MQFLPSFVFVLLQKTLFISLIVLCIIFIVLFKKIFIFFQAWASNYWVSMGVPKSKLNIGLALYGRGFVMDNPANHKPGAPAKGPCSAGEYTRENGYLAYYEVSQIIK